MKNKIINIGLLTLIVTFSTTSCKKYLDQIPTDRITIEQVFQKKDPTEQYLANIYSYIEDYSNSWETHPWNGAADEVDVTWSKYPIYQVNIGNLGPSNAIFDKWSQYYKAIRSATYFINNIDKNAEILSINGQQQLDQYKAEARFLRAYYYTLLMKQYGPVVLLGENSIPADATAEEMQLPRSPYDDCVNYVSTELDKAAAVLPPVPSINGQASNIAYGRATRGMALAVKARLLLYAASPLYNGNTELANFKNLDGKALINQTYDTQKWKKAADASKAVIDLGIYNLYKDPGNDPIKSLQGTFFQAWNVEQIFNRPANNQDGFDVHSTPRQAGGWNGLAVTQEQVDAYFMNDGKPIAESSLYSEAGFSTKDGAQVSNMYMNREPRFYASVTFHNAVFQLGNLKAPAAINFFANGPNGKDGHPTDWSRTGYLIRKNIGTQTNNGSGGTGTKQIRPLTLFRLGEVYLNYVEALNEYAPGNPDILKYLNLIRDRAGVSQYGSANLPLPVSQADMRTRIWQERRVELAFESLRFFDIRRWKIASQVMGDMHGMDISKSDNAGFFKRVVSSTHLFRSPNSYFWPISQFDMDRSKLVVQNPGY